MIDIRAQRFWDRNTFEKLLQHHFSEANYQAHPILDRSLGRFDDHRRELARRKLPTLQKTWDHLGTSRICFADLSTEPSTVRFDFSDDLAIRTLMCIDWRILGLRKRLLALDQIRAETKHGLDWLTGFDGPMPSLSSLSTLQDKFAFLAVKGVGRYFDFGDAWQLRKLRTAFHAKKDSDLIRPIIRLVEYSLTRGCKLGPIVPRLILLREAGYEFDLRPLVYIAARHLVELSHQYVERATTEDECALCFQVALTFLLEAATCQPEDQSFVADTAEEVLKSALYRGVLAQMLAPFHIGDA